MATLNDKARPSASANVDISPCPSGNNGACTAA
jgi:hypothetical protein